MFISLIFIFSARIIHISLNKIEIYNSGKLNHKFNLLRRDIVDRNGELLSRNIKSYHAAVNPLLIKNKDNFLIKLKLNFPDLPLKKIKNKLNKEKYFYLKKRITQSKKKTLSLGEKGEF